MLSRDYSKIFLSYLKKASSVYFSHPSHIKRLCDSSSDPIRLRNRLNSLIWDIDSFLMDLHTCSWNPSEPFPSALGSENEGSAEVKDK